MDILYGLHPVEEALRSGTRRFDHICLLRERGDARLERLASLCRERGVPLRMGSREQLDEAAGTTTHQGAVAVVHPRALLALEDLLIPPAEQSLLLLALDGVEDPQNLGALLRCADGAGVHGVIATERRAAPLSAAAAKAAAGATEHVRVARVVNLVRALEQAKAAGVWVAGLDERGTEPYDRYNYTAPTLLVLGREGAGLHELVRRTCDHLLRIPMAGAIASLNVAAAGAVVLFEAARQRRAALHANASSAPQQSSSGAPKGKQKGLGSF